jgi:hypothetical protein
MAEFVEEREIYPVLVQLAACAQAEVANRGLPEVGKVTVQPGVIPVQDYVGNGRDCAEIIVNMTASYPVNPFPSPDQGGIASCASEFAYEVQLGIFRCAPPVKGTRQNPIFPSPADQLEATRLHLADMAAGKAAIKCCMADRQYTIRSFEPYGPTGNVVGGVWTVVVGQED